MLSPPPAPGRTRRNLVWWFVGPTVVLVAVASVYTMRAIKEAQRSQAETEAGLNSPGGANADWIMRGQPASGAIAPNQVMQASARTPEPTTATRPSQPPSTQQPVPASHQAPAQRTDPQNDIQVAALRRQWEEYYERRSRLEWERFDATRKAMQAGLGEGVVSGAAPEMAGTNVALRPPAEGGEAQQAQQKRPGWLNQGPSSGGWLDARVEMPKGRYNLMKGVTKISCVTDRAIGSELAGMFTAMVDKPVTDAAGNTLIPYGSVLVGSYDQNTGDNQEGLPIGFTDIVFPAVGPHQVQPTLALGTMPGADAQGKSGFRDRVNRHTGRALFRAVVTALAGGASSAVSTAAGGSTAGALAGAAASGVGTATPQAVGRVSSGSTIDIRTGYPCSLTLTDSVPFPGPWVDGVGHVPR